MSVVLFLDISVLYSSEMHKTKKLFISSINNIIEKTNASVVVIGASSQKDHTVTSVSNLMSMYGFNGKVFDVVRSLSYINSTQNVPICMEIYNFIYEKGGSVSKYCIVSDMEEMLESQKNNYVCLDGHNFNESVVISKLISKKSKKYRYLSTLYRGDSVYIGNKKVQFLYIKTGTEFAFMYQNKIGVSKISNVSLERKEKRKDKLINFIKSL